MLSADNICVFLGVSKIEYFKQMESFDLQPYVDSVIKNCIRSETHLIYNGPHANVFFIPNLYVPSVKTVYPARVLYAHKHKVDLRNLGKLKKMCTTRLCLEPNHYCLISNTQTDENGWSEQERQCYLWKLGLLPNSPSPTACVIAPGVKTADGYASLRVKDKKIRAHVASLRLKLGRPLHSKMEASHLCANPGCVNPHHLIEETAAANSRRKAASKLTAAQVHEIIAMYEGGMLQKTIAANFQVSTTTIWSILCGRLHKDLTNISPTQKHTRYTIVITEDKMDEICERLLSCKEVIDEVTGEKHLIPCRKPNVFGYVSTTIFGLATKFHILAAIVKCNLDHFPDRKKNEYVLHKCRRKDCCAYDHVTIGTAKQNAEDKKRDGTNQNHAKINKDTAIDIRESSGTCIDIANEYSVSIGTVKSIKNNQSWIQ